MSPTKAPVPETSVLAARDPAIANSDEWPEFRLNDAIVTLSPESSEPISLLLASENHPLCVVGQVEAVSRDRAHLWIAKSKPRPTLIEASDVRAHAYGAYKDGSVDLWAAGKAGWLRIVPNKKYKAVYDEMVEAVKVMYFVVDAYQTPRKSGRGKHATVLPEYTAQELFEKYAIEVIEVEKAAPEAAKKMYKYKDFLLASMMSDKEGIKWTKNPLYTHLTRKFPKEWKAVKERLDGLKIKDSTREPPKRAIAKVQHERQPSQDSNVSATSSLKRKRGRPPRHSNTDVVSIRSSSAGDSQSAITTIPYHVSANSAPKKQVRLSRATRSNPQQSEPEIEDSQSAANTARESDHDAKRRRKSALRLKPNKSMKGPPKSGRGEEAVEDDDEDELSRDQSPAPRVHMSKRKRVNDVHAKSDSQRRLAKRANSNATRRRPPEAEDEGIDIPESPSDNSDAGAGADVADLSIRQIEQTLLHRSDQLQQDVWTCALDGCTHKVYGPASAPETQKLIREHYSLHAYDDDERVQMVKRMAEPSLPVGHLVDKVRGFVDLELKRMEGTKTGGSRFPENVKKKY